MIKAATIKTATRTSPTLKPAKLPKKEKKTAKSEQRKLIRSLIVSTVIKILLLSFPVTFGNITLLTVNPMSISFLFIPFAIKVPKILKIQKNQRVSLKNPQKPPKTQIQKSPKEEI